MNLSSEWKLEIDFINNDADQAPVTLTWNVIDRWQSYVWLKRLRTLLEGALPFYARFTGFPDGYKSYEYLAGRLNHAIDVINREGRYEIKERATAQFSQEFSNIIHHHFEVLYGSIERCSDIFQLSSRYGMHAIQDLNHFIHDMEALEREKERQGRNSETAFSGIIVEVLDAPKYRMSEDFFDGYSLDIDIGDLTAHYTLVGKTWWEVFIDQDEEIFEEAIRPLNALSGEFDIFFGRYTFSEDIKERFFEFLRKNGKDPTDPKLCLGYLHLAKLENVNNLSNVELKKLLSKKMRIKEIRVMRSGRCESRRSFVECPTIQHGFGAQLDEVGITQESRLPIKRLPIQCIPIRSATGQDFVLGENAIDVDVLDFDHCLCLVGVGGDNEGVILRSSELEGRVNLRQDEIILKNNLQVDFAWNKVEKMYVHIGTHQLKYF
jgi:hypothetical protein